MSAVFPRTLLLSALSAAILAACSPPQDSMAPAPRRVMIETVTAAEPQSRFEFVGRVEARQTVDMAFQVGGQLASLPIPEGQEVAQGELVAELDLEDFRRAEREASVQLQQARNDVERQRTLNERGIASQAALDSAETSYELRVVALETARRNLGYASMRAPFDGLLSRQLVESFTVVSPGQPIVRLYDVSELRVSVPVTEDMIATLEADDLISVQAVFPFLPDEVFALEPREMITEPDAASQTYRAVLALPNDLPVNLLPGMTATVTAEFERPRTDMSNLRVPVRAISYASDGHPSVWVFDGQTVSRRLVQTGDVRDESVLILEGLERGERIVTAGVSALVEGMRVRPLEEDA